MRAGAAEWEEGLQQGYGHPHPQLMLMEQFGSSAKGEDLHQQTHTF